MFAPFDVVVQYDRGKGIRVRKGGDAFHRFLKAFDTFQGTAWAGLPDAGPDKVEALDLGNLLPREPKRALELIDRFLRGAMARTRLVEGKAVADPLKVAVIIDYAQFIAPQGEPLYISDLQPDAHPARRLVGGPGDHRRLHRHRAHHREPRGPEPRCSWRTRTAPRSGSSCRPPRSWRASSRDITRDTPDFDAVCEVPREMLADRSWSGLSRVNVRNLLRRAAHLGASGSPAPTSRR